MKFELVGPMENAEVIAAGPGVRIRAYLRKVHGQGQWRKMKGTGTIRRFTEGGSTLVRSARDRQARVENQTLFV